MIRAVFFDLDGTLVDSAPELTEGVNAIMRVVRMRPFTVEEVSRMVGKGARVLFERVCEARGIFPTDQTIEAMMQEYAKAVRELDVPTAFYPGALEGIDLLRGAGIKAALVTNKMRRMTEDLLERNDLEEAFDAVICGDDTKHPKPEGDMLLLACRQFRISAAEAVMVGDSSNDALAARAAGVKAVLVRTGYNEGMPIDAWAADHGFDTIRDDVKAVCADILENRIR